MLACLPHWDSHLYQPAPEATVSFQGPTTGQRLCLSWPNSLRRYTPLTWIRVQETTWVMASMLWATNSTLTFGQTCSDIMLASGLGISPSSSTQPKHGREHEKGYRQYSTPCSHGNQDRALKYRVEHHWRSLIGEIRKGVLKN